MQNLGIGPAEEEDDMAEEILSNLQDALKILHEKAQEHGIDLNEIDEDELEAHAAESDRRHNEVRKHPLTELCNVYQASVRHFFRTSTSIQHHIIDQIPQVEMGIRSENDAIRHLEEVNDLVEVIQWHSTIPHPKFSRALLGQQEEYDPRIWPDPLQTDWNGSAKVGLVALTDSKAAWVKLLELLPGEEDKMLPVLSKLDQCINMANQLFPDAMKFKRPGFDD